MAPPVRAIQKQQSMSAAPSATIIHAKTIDAGSRIWTEDEDDVWVLVEVLRQENTLLAVQDARTGREREVDLVSD